MSYIDREETIKALDRLCDRVCQYSKAQRYAMCGACPLGDAFDVINDSILDATAMDMADSLKAYCTDRDCEVCVFGRKLTQANADITVCGISLRPDSWELEEDEPWE